MDPLFLIFREGEFPLSKSRENESWNPATWWGFKISKRENIPAKVGRILMHWLEERTIGGGRIQ